MKEPRCPPPSSTSPFLCVFCQALITNKEIEVMQGVGVEQVVVGGCWWQWTKHGGAGGWKQERSERLRGKWVNRLVLSCASPLFINKPGGVDGAL